MTKLPEDIMDAATLALSLDIATSLRILVEQNQIHRALKPVELEVVKGEVVHDLCSRIEQTTEIPPEKLEAMKQLFHAMNEKD